jgi:hypothetical protein
MIRMGEGWVSSAKLPLLHVGVIDHCPIAPGLFGKPPFDTVAHGFEDDAFDDHKIADGTALYGIVGAVKIGPVHAPVFRFPINSRWPMGGGIHHIALERPGDVRHLIQTVRMKILIKIVKTGGRLRGIARSGRCRAGSRCRFGRFVFAGKKGENNGKKDKRMPHVVSFKKSMLRKTKFATLYLPKRADSIHFLV